MSAIVISSPGLNPSNRGNVFPNLARSDQSPEMIAEVTAITDSELRQAGITVSDLRFPVRGEVPTETYGSLSMWGFERAWYYWVAKGPGLPVEVAERLHVTHGTVVRVDGHCGCPSPREWFKGFGVGCYHVDTQEGLNALADAIRSVYDPAKDPTATPRTGAPREMAREGVQGWVARVVLHKDQAIVCFPKFGTIGCGFAQEEDWNTNLPIRCGAEEIYQHIKHNKKYEEITDEMCLEAIRALQVAFAPKVVKEAY